MRRMLRNNKNIWYAFIILIALALRIYVVIVHGHQMFLGTDDDNYRESAQILLEQGTLTYGGWPGPTVFIMPGYPIFLAGIFALFGSPDWLAARFVQAVVSVGTVWLAMMLGRKMGGWETGVLAGLLMALYPPNLTAPAFLMTETIFTFFLLLCIWSLIKGVDSGRLRWFYITGLVLGLSIYFRPTSGLLSIVFVVYFWACRLSWKSILKNVFVIGMVSFVLLSPWIIRNYMAFKAFIPFTVSGGNPFLRGTYIDDKINEKFPWVKGDRIQSDRLQMERGKERIEEGFGQDFNGYLKWYTLGKLKKMWLEPYYLKPLSILPSDIVTIVHRLLLITGFLGLILGLLYCRALTMLFLSVLGYFTFMHLIYLAAPRYSYPVMQLLLITAAYTISKIITFFTHPSI